jgi:ABC-2 type transport system ATP-binding protein
MSANQTDDTRSTIPTDRSHAIRTDGLRKSYGDVTAIDGVDLTVEAGEVFGFLGPNGAGKSTLISVLLGYVTPTAGTATVLGHDVTESPRAVRTETGVLPENVGVYDRLTAREHVESVARIQCADADPEELLSRVGLSRDAWDRPAGEFSTGMEQRLALATALVGEPDLLVLDEPQSGLDPNGMAEIREIVREEAASGTTVFFSSHIISAVAAVADRVGVMRAGELVAEDTVENLRERLGGETVVRAELVDPPKDRSILTSLDGVTDVAVNPESDDGSHPDADDGSHPDADDGSHPDADDGSHPDADDGSQTNEIHHRVDITCREPRAKARALAVLEKTVGVADFTVDRGSLEDSFTSLTETAEAGERSPGDDAEDRSEPVPDRTEVSGA